MTPRAFDWVAIEGAYRAGKRSIRSIADEHGLSDMAIRKRAKKFGWTRDPEGAVRENVKARLSGSVEGSQLALRTIEEAAEAYTRDMETGLRIYRGVLSAMESAISSMAGVVEAKIITETTQKAIEGIRRIGGLDDPQVQQLPDQLVISLPS